MRIVVVCPYALDQPGGVQGQALGMAATFARNHDVLLVAPGSDPSAGVQASNVTTELLGPTVSFPANGSVAPIGLRPTTWLRLRRAVERFRPELSIVHEPFVPLVGWAALAGRSQVRIGTFHRADGLPALSLLSSITKAAAARLDAGVVVSEAARAALRPLVGARTDRFVTIPNAISPDRFAPDRFAPGCERRVDKTILFVGRHEPRKGLSTLLEAVARLPPGYLLEVVGTGPLSAQLQREFARMTNVVWAGRLDDDELALRFDRAALFVAPALGGESFGVILLEAMAAGVPVICSDLPGFREAAGNAALYVPPGDPDALAHAIDELSGRPEERERLRAAGLARVGRFSFDKQSNRYLELFSSVVSLR